MSKVVFMGSPDFAVPTLDALIGADDIDVACVVSQPDRPKGRGRKLTPTPVRRRAIERAIPTHEMSKKNYAEVLGEIAPIDPDFIVVAAFGLILRADLLGLPRLGCVNLHPSLLPRHRGVSPVQSAILAGDNETGCSTMLMDEGVDTGDVLLVESIPLGDDETAGTLGDKLARLGAHLIVDTLRGIVAGTVRPLKQDDRLATYSKKIKKEHGAIDWTQGAADVSRQIRAMTPWPSAYTSYRGKRLIVLDAAVGDRQAVRAAPGTIVSLEPLGVATGAGTIELAMVKIEGKKSMSAESFRAGYRVENGDLLGAPESGTV